MKRFIRHLHKQAGNTNSKVIFLLLGLSLLGVGAYAGLNQRLNNPSQQSPNQPQSSITPGESSPKVESPHTVVYGFWAGNNSII